jgi:hypothetical protein
MTNVENLSHSGAARHWRGTEAREFFTWPLISLLRQANCLPWDWLGASGRRGKPGGPPRRGTEAQCLALIRLTELALGPFDGVL